MEPLFPSDRTGVLDDLAVDLVRKAAALGSIVHPATSESLAGTLRQMNSYYSNLIEGHGTHPIDIARALEQDFSHDRVQRNLQLESKAHVEVQQLMERRLQTEPRLDIATEAFLRWIHGEFYSRMPAEYCRSRDVDGTERPFEPGELRTSEVRVGRHIPPANDSLPSFLARFAEKYSPFGRRPLEQIIAAAASHHRLVWIHPFPDGNGRVARLFTHAYLIRAGADARGLWAISRGLARRRDDYLAELGWADADRQGDLDGRGNLSNDGLRHFCDFFLRTAIDQVEFMTASLTLDGLSGRIESYVERRVAEGAMRPQAIYLLLEALAKGEVARGDASRLTGLPERTARLVVSSLVRDGHLVSPTPKGPLRLGYPLTAVGYFFPRLYPEGIELELAARPSPSRRRRRRPK